MSAPRKTAKDRDNIWQRQRRPDFDGADKGAGMWASDEGRVEHAWQAEVVDKVGTTQEQPSILQVAQWSTDVARPGCSLGHEWYPDCGGRQRRRQGRVGGEAVG
jgi:hypothetical protein